MALFPSTMPMSSPIVVAGDSKSPYQWAAELAPKEEGKLVQYKNAMLWLEGETFGSTEDFLAKVQRVIAYQEAENHRPTATASVPEDQAEEAEKSKGGGFQTVAAPKRKAKQAVAAWTKQEVAKAIVDGCIRELKRTFKYAGPSLEICSVYSRFKPDDFSYPQLIGAVRDEIEKLRVPSEEGFAVPKSARYQAASGPGKGKNFNFKVQKKDSTAPNGWSAVAQIHVLWK